MMSTDIFSKFGGFPPEIQDMIWDCAINDVEGRTVQINESQFWEKGPYLRDVPSILHAYGRSHNLGRRRRKLLSFVSSHDQPTERHEPIFVDIDRDLLYLPRVARPPRQYLCWEEDIEAKLSEGERAMIRSVAMPNSAAQKHHQHC